MIKPVKKVVEWRADKGWTQKEAAEKMGVAVSTYNIWENNPEKIQLEDSLRFAKLFEVDIDQIIFFNKQSNLKYVLNVG